MKISVQIIEDNPMAADALVAMCDTNINLEVVGRVQTLESGRDMIFANRPALLFLDIELPDGNGIEFWDEIRQLVTWPMHVIFYTAFDHYVIDALRAQAHDYLVKPITEEDFKLAIERYYHKCTERLLSGSANVAAASEKDTPLLVVDNVNNRIVIPLSNIGMFRYLNERKIWEAVCTDGNCYAMRHGSNAERLTSINNNFVRVHRSYIINIQYMTRFDDGNIVFAPPFDNITEVTVSKNYRSTLFERFCML